MSGKGIDMDCTIHCMSVSHGDILTSAVTRREPSDQEIAVYFSNICSNVGCVADKLGRIPLHMAASCGRRELVQWLIRRCGAPVNLKDIESGYTALHRSLFYGQLHVAVNLMQLGASLTLADYDALSPLDHVVKDRFPYVQYNRQRSCEAYVWGSNSNYTLGTGNQQAKLQPEILEFFRRMDVSVQQVCIDKFHSIMVTACGRAFSCGHGQGGRLGLGTESTVLRPQEIPLGTISATTSLHASQQNVGASEVCIMAAVARDHTLLLTESGAVLTCGMNSHHVLGHSPPPQRLLKPRPILAKQLRQVSDGITGICAGRFHSVIWSRKGVLTFGLHGGQLGHVESPEKTVLFPKAVTCFPHKDVDVSHVAASDGATVVVYNSKVIFVLHEYQKTRLTAKNAFEVNQVAVTGGHLNARLDSDSLGEKGEKLRVVALSSVGTVYLWEEKQLHLTRCILALNRPLIIRHLAVNRAGLLFVTEDGEGFSGEVKPRKKSDEARPVHPQTRTPENKDQSAPLRVFLDANECDTIRLERLPQLHRAVSITCDPKGRNFAAIQTHPSAYLTDVPQIPPQTLMQHLSDLLHETNVGDVLHDVVFQVGLRSFPAHQFIVGSCSEMLLKLINSAKDNWGTDKPLVIEVDNIHPNVFEHLLQYMYSGRSSLTKPGSCDVLIGDSGKSDLPDSVITQDIDNSKKHPGSKKKNRDNKKGKINIEPSNPLSLTRDAARQLGLFCLVHQLDAVRFDNGLIVWSEDRKKVVPNKSLTLSVTHLPELHDVIIQTTDNKKYGAHKCVLAARCEYFHHMFSGGWIETSSSRELNLPLHSSVLVVLFDYIYKDATPALDNLSCEDLELAWKSLISADQFLIAPFKARCEAALASKLTLRNAAIILEMAHTYNANQLLNCCYQYICLNLPAILEGRSLEGVTLQILDGLREYYQKDHPRMSCRIVTPFSDAPSCEEVLSLAETHEISWNPDEDMNSDLDEQNDAIRSRQTKKKVRMRRIGDVGKGRQRNESVSSTNSDEIDTSAECEKLDWNDLVEKTDPVVILSLHKVSPSKGNDLKENVASDWVKVIGSSKIQKSVQARLKAAAQAREEPQQTAFISLTTAKQERHPSLISSSPTKELSMKTIETTTSTKPVAIEVLQRHFPQLGQEDICKNSSKPSLISTITVNKVSTNDKRHSKLSQKQRKKIAADDAVIGSPPSGVRGWTTVEESYCVNSPPSSSSLADIMHEQISKAKHSVSSPINIISSVVKPSTTGSASPNSPWKRMQVMNSPPSVIPAGPSLSGIMAQEIKQRENWTKMKTKPLALTQIEDKAIDDLINFYNANNASEERITVRRVVVTDIAKPQWVTIRH